MSVPTFLPYYVLIGTAGIIIVILRGLHLALVRGNERSASGLFVPPPSYL